MHIFLGATLVIAPFLLGLNRPLAWSLWALLLTAALAWHWRQWAPLRATDVLNAAGLPRTALFFATMFAVALPLLQLSGGVCTDALPSTPCVADVEPGWLGLAHALMLACWFLLLSGPERPSTERVLMAMTLAGAVQAVYALLTHFLHITPLFLDGVFHHDKVPTGGFANRNHFAAFLYLAIFAGIALVLRLPADTGSGRAARWRWLLDQRLLWRLAVVVMVLALIATRSRAGNAVFVIGLLAGFAWLMLVERRHALPGKPLRWRFVVTVIVSVLVVDALLLGSLVGLNKVRQRISDTALVSEQRDNVNAVLLAHSELLLAPLGHGTGSFAAVFDAIKPANLPLHYAQAHNDYLQVLVERGWVGALLFTSALLTVLAAALGAARPPARRHAGMEIRFALVAATSALALHATVEFVTQVPVLWLMWLGLLALALRPRRAT